MLAVLRIRFYNNNDDDDDDDDNNNNNNNNNNNKLVRLIALQYAARKCKQNKRYHTSGRLTLAYNRKAKFSILDVRS